MESTKFPRWDDFCMYGYYELIHVKITLVIQRHKTNALTSMWGLCFHWVLGLTARAIDQESTHARIEENDNYETQHTD